MSLHEILPLVQAFFSLLLAPMVIRRHFQSTIHRLFFFYLLLMTFWGVLIFAMRTSPTLEQAYFWEKTLIWIGPLMTVVLYHFTVRFIMRKVPQKLLYLFYSIAFVFLVISRTDLLVKGMRIEHFWYSAIGGTLFPLLVFFIYMMLIMALNNLVQGFRKSQNVNQRNRSGYIMIGLIISLLGGLFDVLPIMGLPFYPGAIVGNIIFCLITTIAIVKHNLLDIKLVIRKGTAYFLASIAVALPYVAVVMLFIRLISHDVPIWMHVILVILISIVLQPLWRRMQSMVDRWFYRKNYDHLRALEDFSTTSHKIGDISELGTSLVKLVYSALQSSGVSLLLSSYRGEFETISYIGGEAYHFDSIGRGSLIKWLQTSRQMFHRKDFSAIPYLQSLSAMEIDELDNAKADLFLPILTRDDEVVGVLILGVKLSQQPYSNEDKRLLLSVVSRMAIELENARLFAKERDIARELERQNKEKTEFLHAVAHELKTPLTAVISSSELVDMELKADSGLIKKLATNIHQSALKLDKRIDEILNIAKIEVGTLDLDITPIEIGTIIQEVILQYTSLFSKKQQSLIQEIPDNLLYVMADRLTLEQILSNLLSNAYKFSPIGSSIIIKVKEVNNEVVFEVRDSSPPVPEEEQERIFAPYFRGGSTKSRRRIPGLGLGLAITKKLVELHMGKLWIEKYTGKGNIFAFSLPKYEPEIK